MSHPPSGGPISRLPPNNLLVAETQQQVAASRGLQHADSAKLTTALERCECLL
jgi:hypothetical protein